MTENKAISGLKRLFSEHELDLPCTESLEVLHTAIKALEEVQQYREMDNRLKNVYGDCTDLLEIVITHLERHDGVDIPEPVFKARLLTDGEVDKWEAYKAIGTAEECRAAVEKMKR